MKNIAKVLGVVATYVFTWKVLERACERIEESKDIKTIEEKHLVAFTTGFILAFIQNRIVTAIIRK